jgi:large repetitive protein
MVLSPLRFTLVSRPAHGVAVLTNAAAGTYIYKPRRNFDGTDSFAFQATDGSVDSNVATVVVTVRDDDRERRHRKKPGK